jgi:hypothetical protein
MYAYRLTVNFADEQSGWRVGQCLNRLREANAEFHVAKVVLREAAVYFFLPLDEAAGITLDALLSATRGDLDRIWADSLPSLIVSLLRDNAQRKQADKPKPKPVVTTRSVQPPRPQNPQDAYPVLMACVTKVLELGSWAARTLYELWNRHHGKKQPKDPKAQRQKAER